MRFASAHPSLHSDYARSIGKNIRVQGSNRGPPKPGAEIKPRDYLAPPLQNFFNAVQNFFIAVCNIEWDFKDLLILVMPSRHPLIITLSPYKTGSRKLQK